MDIKARRVLRYAVWGAEERTADKILEEKVIYWKFDKSRIRDNFGGPIV